MRLRRCERSDPSCREVTEQDQWGWDRRQDDESGGIPEIRAEAEKAVLEHQVRAMEQNLAELKKRLSKIA